MRFTEHYSRTNLIKKNLEKLREVSQSQVKKAKRLQPLHPELSVESLAGFSKVKKPSLRGS